MTDLTTLIEIKLRQDSREREDTIRWLLAQWVSGCEPAIAEGPNHEILGLCDADAPLGSKPFIFSVWE